MYKKRIIIFIALFLLAGTTTIYAKTAIDKCPVVTGTQNTGNYTPFQIHQMKPPVSNDYKSWITTDGGMYWLHETWTCSYCGNFITKDTFLGSNTDITSDEEDKENDTDN